MKIKLALAFAQGHWARGSNNGNWVVQDESGNVLCELPPGFDEIKVMAAIRMGRRYELEAFNTGIKFGKQKAAEVSRVLLLAKDNQIRSLAAMNEQLSEQLEKQIEG